MSKEGTVVLFSVFGLHLGAIKNKHEVYCKFAKNY